MKSISFVLIAISFICSGCQSKVAGDVEVDGKAFEVKECRSGQAFGFSGIELTDATERRLRMFAQPDGTLHVAIFEDAGPTGERLGTCGTLAIEAQSSKINNITNIRGTAKLSCETGRHKVRGSVEFANCH